MNKLHLLGAAALMVVFAAPGLAQTPPATSPAPTGPAPLAILNPTYVSIPMEITINKPAKDVWKRVGKYCDISEWLQIAAGCKMISGTEGDVGSVRSVGNEILVGKTELSYSYTQPVREGRPYNLYHGTLEARPLTAKTTKMVYTLMYDNSLIPGDEAAKAAEIQRRRTSFERGLANMKILAEGGQLPPPPTRGAPPPTPPKP
ncbi:MAG: SRPBCC family protein [Alphaproteobacteria bacterium]